MAGRGFYNFATVRVEGLAGLAANFYSADKKLRRSIVRTAHWAGRETVRLARSRVPWRTGLTYNSIKYTVSPEGRSVQIFPDPESFRAAGKNYYPPWIEFDSTYPAIPFMWPSWNDVRPKYEARLKKALREAHRRV